jgi:hypothetical protein
MAMSAYMAQGVGQYFMVLVGMFDRRFWHHCLFSAFGDWLACLGNYGSGNSERSAYLNPA